MKQYHEYRPMVILSVVTTYVQIGKNLQLPVAVLLKVSHFLDDVTRGTVLPS